MENLEMIKPQRVQNIINKFCLTIGMLPTSYKISMTYEEQILAIGHYLETTVYPAINNNAEALAELQNLFIELKDYVDNYFDDLDIQDEIDNKLDDMAEQGILQEIISEYLQLQGLLCYDTVSDMKNVSNLVNGSFVKTYGFYAKNDGGGAFYKIRTVTNDDSVNNMNLIPLSNDNSLVAELITNIVNVLQFGAKGDGTTDDTNFLQTASDYAEINNLEFYVPNKVFLTDTITLNNIKKINILGEIKLSANTENLNVYENVNSGNTPDIFINKITIGNIIMKGLNSADVRIQNAVKLRLIADNTENHNFIGFTKFYLGFVRYLELYDDGSGTKWINENLFIGGRFLGITIDGTYSHHGNVFLKPMCENTEITFNVGSQNRIIDARLEGNNTHITFGENTYSNYVSCNYASSIASKYIPKNEYFQSFITDNSNGKNRFAINEDLIENRVISLNAFNNPKQTPVTDGKLTPTTNDLMWETDFIELPTIDTCLYFTLSDPNVAIRLECYDSTKTKLSTNPNLLINSPTISYTSAGTYGNASYTRNNYWMILDSSNVDVKYIKLKILRNTSSTPSIKNVDVYMTHYGKLENEGYYIEGLKNCI